MNYYPPSALQNANSSSTKITIQQMDFQQSSKPSLTQGRREIPSRKLLAQMICQKQIGILLKTRENGELDNKKQNKQSAIGRRKTVAPEHKPECFSRCCSLLQHCLPISIKLFTQYLPRIAELGPCGSKRDLSWPVLSPLVAAGALCRRHTLVLFKTSLNFDINVLLLIYNKYKKK